jgi:hypothetical protein
MKKLILLFLTLSLVLTACRTTTTNATETATTTTDAAQAAPVVASDPLAVSYADEDEAPASAETAVQIMLAGDSITVEGSGAAVNGSTVTIITPGVYNLTGTLNDGQIVVDTDQEGTVNLILSGVNITNSSTSPIFISSADKTILTLAEGSQNIVTDGATYVFSSAEVDEPNAAIFSKDDLVINGSGSLTVNANYNNGIASKDYLRIVSGNITVNAVNDGIKGRNYIAVKDATITVNAGGDGLQSNNDEDATKGYILIEGGIFKITTGLDGIQAETQLTVNSGTLNLITGGGNTVNYESEESAKGLKAGVSVTIAGGTINIDSADDAVHANGSVMVSGGDLQITSGDDGIHADVAITINDGNVNIIKAYEGIESVLITINGGNIHLNTEDDGINGSGGVDGSSVNGRPGQNQFEAGNAQVFLNGGYLYLNAQGDGLDSNGTMAMSGGTVIVNGPTNNGNGSLDFSSFDISGGYLITAGSSGMAQSPSTSSTQYSVMYNFDTMQSAGTLVHIETENGEEALTFAPAKEFQSVVVSSPELVNGSTYVVYLGGSTTGTPIDGLYSDGSYTAGSQVASFIISSMVTTLGAAHRHNRNFPHRTSP